MNPKTVAKWLRRTSVADLPTSPRQAHSSTLTAEQEAIVVACRCHNLLLLDDCLYAPQATIPHLMRSSLHRCLEIAFFHIDIAEVQTAEGKLHLFVAIDRTSKFAFVQLVENATRVTASAFLEALVAALPYRIHTVLTDNVRCREELRRNGRPVPIASLG